MTDSKTNDYRSRNRFCECARSGSEKCRAKEEHLCSCENNSLEICKLNIPHCKHSCTCQEYGPIICKSTKHECSCKEFGSIACKLTKQQCVYAKHDCSGICKLSKHECSCKKSVLDCKSEDWHECSCVKHFRSGKKNICMARAHICTCLYVGPDRCKNRTEFDHACVCRAFGPNICRSNIRHYCICEVLFWQCRERDWCHEWC